MISERRRSPWAYIPLLYFLQAVPVALVQEVSTVVYKDLGIPNELILRWTSLIALPWSLQMLFGPLVDLNSTKRKWILGGQALIAIALVLSAFLTNLPHAFELTLVIFAASAILSTLCNIATDGFAIMAMDTTEQARFAGIMSTFYKLGRLFCVSLLVFVAGRMMPVTTPENARHVWAIVLMIAAGVYGVGHLIARFVLPTVASDVPRTAPDFTMLAPGDPSPPSPLSPRGARGSTSSNETQENLKRTLYLVGTMLTGYFAGNAVVRLVADVLADPLHLPGWHLPATNHIPLLDGMLAGPPPGQIGGPVQTELAQLVLCGAIAGFCFSQARRTIRGSQMGESLSTFFAQPGIRGIVFFILFYRMAEAMVSKMSALFLKDTIANGGLALPNEQLGTLNGLMGIGGIIVGGILGGFVVSKIGLRRAFWPLAFAMHLPNLLYLLVSLHAIPMLSLQLPFIGPLNWTMGLVLFVDQFGYGFGYAAYMVYLMRVAQRGQFATSHYAIAVGLGALTIAMSGILGGVIQSNFGYPGFFVAVMIVAIPGLLSLLFIPLEEPAA